MLQREYPHGETDHATWADATDHRLERFGEPAKLVVIQSIAKLVNMRLKWIERGNVSPATLAELRVVFDELLAELEIT